MTILRLYWEEPRENEVLISIDKDESVGAIKEAIDDYLDEHPDYQTGELIDYITANFNATLPELETKRLPP